MKNEQRSPVMALLKEIEALRCNFLDFKFTYASRVCNRVSHELARQGMSAAQVCYTGLWEDQIRKYFEDLVRYFRSSTLDILQEELSVCKSEVSFLSTENLKLTEEMNYDSEDDVAPLRASKPSQVQKKGLACFNTNWVVEEGLWAILNLDIQKRDCVADLL
ncbi:hypothetical protein EJB05_23393, partial [Eragrostis curvula]